MYFRKVLFSDTLHIAAYRLQSQKAGYALHFKQGWGAKVLLCPFNFGGALSCYYFTSCSFEYTKKVVDIWILRKILKLF